MFNVIYGVASQWPKTISSIIIGTRYIIGDAITQSSTNDESSSIDFRRMFCFGLFGVVAGATGYHWTYNMLYATKPFQRIGAFGTAAFDCGVMLPTWYFASFYVFQEFLMNPLPVKSVALSLSNAKEKYLQNYWDNTKLCFTVPFGQVVIMHKFVPQYLRSPFIGVSGLVWVVLLSYVRGSYATIREGS